MKLNKSQKYIVQVFVNNFENDQLTYNWEILYESTDMGVGGDRESRPDNIEGLVTNLEDGKIELKAPGESGAYRLFVYVMDNENKVATANIPFFVN